MSGPCCRRSRERGRHRDVDGDRGGEAERRQREVGLVLAVVQDVDPARHRRDVASSMNGRSIMLPMGWSRSRLPNPPSWFAVASAFEVTSDRAVTLTFPPAVRSRAMRAVVVSRATVTAIAAPARVGARRLRGGGGRDEVRVRGDDVDGRPDREGRRAGEHLGGGRAASRRTRPRPPRTRPRRPTRPRRLSSPRRPDRLDVDRTRARDGTRAERRACRREHGVGSDRAADADHRVGRDSRERPGGIDGRVGR